MVRFRDGLIRVGLVASLLLPVYFLIAALGTKFHLLEWRFGFGVLVLAGGALLLLIVFVLALLGLILAFVVKPRRGWRSALVALIVLLILDLRMSVAIPPGFVDEFIDTVNKRRFKEAFEIGRAHV